jgi:uncharacterized protein YhaN
MRLQHLDLRRYGHFTDRTIELPAGERDLHIVFGPNEAGKSTALAAIEDLLFGIHPQSRFGFLHDYRDMRVGAGLEQRGETLELVRRKGLKDTLLDAEGLPLPGGEAALRMFLAGADRAFFTRMFSLDPVRLETGGRELLEAGDEIGQMLFSAGAGIAGLRERLALLEQEADELWGPRKASRRRYSQAEERLDMLERDLREQTLTAAEWQQRRDTLDHAEREVAALSEEVERLASEQGRLERIRRVYRAVRQKAEIESELAAEGPVPALPEAAGTAFEDAQRAEVDAASRIDWVAQQLEQARAERAALSCDETLLQREQDIALLHERRIEIRRERADLPKRQAELEADRASLLELARELGWPDTDADRLIDSLPPRSRLGLLRTLLAERGERAAQRSVAQVASAQAEDEMTRIGRELAARPEVPDVSRLDAVLASVRERGDVAAGLQRSELEVREAALRCDQALALLQPSLPAEALAELAVPARAQVQEFRDRLRDARSAQRATEQLLQAADDALEVERRALEQAAVDDAGIRKEDLTTARRDRDRLWDLLRRRFIDADALSDSEAAELAQASPDPASAFEALRDAADRVADGRFDQGAALGRLAEQERSVAARYEARGGLHREQERRAAEVERLEQAWQVLWRGLPLPVQDPDAMLEWLHKRDAVLEADRQRGAAHARLDAQRLEESRARESILDALTEAGVAIDAWRSDALPVLLERATKRWRLLEEATRETVRWHQSWADAQADLDRCRGECERAEAAWVAWLQRWSAALEGLGLAADGEPEEVSRQIDLIERMRDLAQQITTLRRDRIQRIEADIADFGASVQVLVAELAEDLQGRPAEEVVLELERRLAQAQEVRQRQLAQEVHVRELERQMSAHEDMRRQAREVLARLRQTAGVATDDALREVIDRSERRRGLESSRVQVLQVLEQDGDGYPIAELEQECDGADLDRNRARQDTIDELLQALRGRQAEQFELRAQARKAFQALGGHDLAARSAAQREEALADMRDAAERYARARAAALLLRWAIDRFRRDRQGPLLRRAGALFATLTGGSFTGLRVEYDEQDRPALNGLRADGTPVPVSGLSQGSADQLYLALRVASIEDYLERAPGLPFIADDLFVHFDDARSAAGFAVLGELAQKTQVLFFTHHRHLVDIAREQLGEPLHVEALV